MKTIKPYQMLAQILFLLACSSLYGQTVISDSTYDPADWSVSVVTQFGASETHAQRLTGGNPGAYRYMEHILPAPEGLNDLARVEVTHINVLDFYYPFFDGAIDHIDYAEDIRLLNLPWNQAFIRSFPAIQQSGRIFRANVFLQVVADTLWRRGSFTGLGAFDFVALDGSGDRPDFGVFGDTLRFGFWRISTRGATLPPIPPNQNLVYQHGSDNFTVTIYQEPPRNRLPVARNDDYLYVDFFVIRRPVVLPVLENDSDPDGDPIRIIRVVDPVYGTILSFNDTTITYVNQASLSSIVGDRFYYEITDDQNQRSLAFVTVHFCICPIECISFFLQQAAIALNRTASNVTAWASAADTLDVELFRRFRDDVLLPTETGARFVDLYYRNAPEVMPLLIFNRPDLGLQAMRALQMMQDPLRNLADGDGSEIITQTLVDSVSAFLDSLKIAVSDSLRDSLNVELARLGPLQELVGLPVAQAAEKALRVLTHVDDRIVSPNDFALKQNYPNPFNPATQISYTLPQAAHVKLAIYNLQGQEIKTLVDKWQSAGAKSVIWDGTDNRAREMTSGIYFYRLRAGAFRKTQKMILMR
jgi:hypothetical protein